MKSYRECLMEAKEKKVAVGHFNISDILGLWAIFRAARSLNVPVIIGVSEGERDFIGVRQVAALVKSIREQFDYPIFLNADHTYSLEKIKEAVEAGFDSVIFDGLKSSLEENIKITKESVEYAKKPSPDLLVEGEIGFIGKSSKLLDSVPDDVDLSEKSLADPNQVKEFVDKTGVDMIAPAVGNLHGMLKSGGNPKLNIERIKQISEAVDVPLVLHGGSGSSDEDFKAAIANGISIIHINTEIRIAYKKGLQIGLEQNPDEIAPYKFLPPAVEAMEKVVRSRLALFNNT